MEQNSLPFKTIAERKRLVGKTVAVTNYSGRVIVGEVKEAMGRNLRIDRSGIIDWLWVPDIYVIKATS